MGDCPLRVRRTQQPHPPARLADHRFATSESVQKQIVATNQPSREPVKIDVEERVQRHAIGERRFATGGRALCHALALGVLGCLNNPDPYSPRQQPCPIFIGRALQVRGRAKAAPGETTSYPLCCQAEQRSSRARQKSQPFQPHAACPCGFAVSFPAVPPCSERGGAMLRYRCAHCSTSSVGVCAND